ncbi:MAG: tRNA uridine(34) 5-carboxymethylaminomethyl modification radical SAM/GNAT enzyme Elp3 [Candidatus Moranbacteria bacterium]|nr:tRNA uridine(34) 5-carboxymethylaminomethyl modification radical SAM/GNAT enzyme Elp3 [Candidatus Moranbacteria bacterium]
MKNQALKEIISFLAKNKILNQEKLKTAKREISKKYQIPFLRNEEIRNYYLKLVKQGKIKKNPFIESLLVLKKTRTLSGVSVVAVLTKNFPCKNNCLYCPDEEKMPKSYLSNEPAVMRAIRLNFNPFYQVKKRIEVLLYNGHNASKIELIVMGGTFSHLPEKYQYYFIANCFWAANSFDKKTTSRPISLKLDLTEIKTRLKKEQRKNASRTHRIVGLTLETRPDMINLLELIKFRQLGCTRVEIGVQSIFDHVLQLNNRGHSVKTTIKATRLLKDMGFKINYHIMPGLYGSSFKKDLKMFRQLFENENFQPDMLKIYPCVVTRNSGLYKLWKNKKFKPLTNNKLKKLIIEIKKIIPPYVRITRLIRDIPNESIIAGPNIPNLREVLKNKKVRCSCIRCREIGRAKPNFGFKTKPKLDRIDYKASKGREIFLQYVSARDNLIHAFLRLRIPSKIKTVNELQDCAIIRELHSYGTVAPIGKKIPETSQHKGYGKKLIKKAQTIAKKETRLSRLAVIAAEGTKDYYKAQGFRQGTFYMIKKI